MDTMLVAHGTSFRFGMTGLEQSDLDSILHLHWTTIRDAMTVSHHGVRSVGATALLLLCLEAQVWSTEQPFLLQPCPPGKAIATLPGGDPCILYMVSGQHCASIRSGDGGATWSKPRVEFEFRKPAGVPVVLVDQERAREGDSHLLSRLLLS